MSHLSFSSSFRSHLASKTVIVTGGANRIGEQTIRHYHEYGANVVIADVPSTQSKAEEIIASLTDQSRLIFVPVDICDWASMRGLYSTTINKFGRVDIVVANAGIMESSEFFDFKVDADGNLEENAEASRVIDVNLKGTMNTLRLAMFHMAENPVSDDGWRGSIVLVSSTSGYFGRTGVISYITSKHGVIGLLRSGQTAANRCGIRLNGVAPFITPTFITDGYSKSWREQGLPTNTPDHVACGIIQMALDPKKQGQCGLIVGGQIKEIESSRAEMIPTWMGQDIADAMQKAGTFFQGLGGYPLPQKRIPSIN